MDFGLGLIGCFITTAVCKNSSKPDECYELQTLRNFRDNWLRKQPDGEILIQKYYHVAPKIVTLIDQSPNSSEVYDTINREYIEPCLEYIESGKMEACKNHYTDMVNTLAKRYQV